MNQIAVKKKILKLCLLSFFKILNGGNVTKSILHFHPRPSDHGKTLTCRAENTELPHAAIEDHWKLVIHCKENNLIYVALNRPILVPFEYRIY